MHELFHTKRHVTYKMIADWLVREGDAVHPVVKGGQGESGLESKMGSYIFFAKDIFGVGELDVSDYPAIEKIILWNTLFEDRSILKEKLQNEFGSAGNGMLSSEQIKKICRKRLTGWGRLSKKFLCDIKVDTQAARRVSIMDVLREGNPNADRRQGETMVMIEALRDDTLDFQKKIDEHNRSYYVKNGKEMGVNELPGSPALRRSLSQAMHIVDEIVKIAGHAPANIFIEVTREEDVNKKGKRTKKRWDSIEEALKRFKEEGGNLEVMGDFKELKATNVDLDERLTLYLMQNGKCLYSGKAINLEKLMAGSGDYEVDHIIPRAYIKDDSLDNKALVCREENQRKTDQMLLDESIRRKMRRMWDDFHSAKMMSDKKHRNLLRSNIDENAMKGFIARQLVETSQIVKHAQALLSVRYPETKIVSVKASMSHNLRDAAGLVKCREANDFHHAHDAYLACRLGLFIQMRHPDMYENRIGYSHVIKKYVREQSELFKKTHAMPGSAGFVVNSFMTAGFDPETGEIFADAWDESDTTKRYKGKIFSDAWNAKAEVEGIRRALNYRQSYISRMPQEDTGAFWDATVYSPRSGKKLELPLKKGLDPEKYGSYSREQFAYFYIYEAKKKGKRLFQFDQVPVSVAKQINDKAITLDEFAKVRVESVGLEYVGIHHRKILKKQLVEIDGCRLCLTGAEEFRNATEIAFSVEECQLFSNQELSTLQEPLMDSVWSRLCSERGPLQGFLGKQIALDGYKHEYPKLLPQQKLNLILAIVKLANAGSNTVDLSCVGGVKNAGKIRPARNKLLNDPKTSFYIIDQSVTGMFERKTRVGL